MLSHKPVSIPLSLYIHYPWCIKKCPYCDFNSHPDRSDLDSEHYVDALIIDLESQLPSIWGRSISSIFIGGGTPSLMTAAQLDRLLSAIRARLNLTGSCEITMEANPGTFEAERFAAFREAGVNRLSIGIQSFKDEYLKKLGRIHSSQEAIAAVKMAQQVGFENINLDLMFGLPGQSVNESLQDLQRAISLKPQHISWYQLTIEPNTEFGAFPPKVPDDEAIWQQTVQGETLLEKAGYRRYEISAYCQQGFESRHNLNYWKFGDYLGIGAGAHGKVTNLAEGVIYRTSKAKHPKSYLKGDNLVTECHPVNEDELLLEFMMNGLRLKQGFSPALLQDRANISLGSITSILNECQNLGLMEWSQKHIKATDKGYRHLDELLQRFL